jgi:hypothetical protein
MLTRIRSGSGGGGGVVIGPGNPSAELEFE